MSAVFVDTAGWMACADHRDLTAEEESRTNAHLQARCNDLLDSWSRVGKRQHELGGPGGDRGRTAGVGGAPAPACRPNRLGVSSLKRACGAGYRLMAAVCR